MSRSNIPYTLLNGEIWIDIKGFEGLYSVSNKLRVRSEQREGVNGFTINEKILRHGIHKSGYAKFTLCKDGKFSYVNRHRLVAVAFIPNPYNLPCINHIDNDPSNDSIENLEWCTFSHNTRHAYRTGRLGKSGSKNSMSKLKEEQVLLIFNSKDKRDEIADKFKICWQTVNDIKAGRRWGWLTGKENKKVKKRIIDENYIT